MTDDKLYLVSGNGFLKYVLCDVWHLTQLFSCNYRGLGGAVNIDSTVFKKQINKISQNEHRDDNFLSGK